MAYCTASDIQELIAKFSLTASSTPNTTQVADIIDQIAGEIDSVLSAQGVTVPATTPSEFTKMLEALNAYGAAAGVLKSMFPDSTGAGETPAYQFWETRYRNGLAALKDGSMIPNAVVGTSTGYLAPSTYFLNNPDTEDDIDLGTAGEPFFTRSKVF